MPEPVSDPPVAADAAESCRLPVADVLDRVVAASRRGAAIVTAPPGSGKTTLVPAALLDDLGTGGGVVLLQPRRLAARAVARRIAELRGGAIGGEVGYQVRFDRRVGRDTRLVVETTGIMLRRLVDDITLPGIAAVVLDEFHERSLEMDVVLGLLVRLRRTVRPDLRVVVMSATLAAEAVARLLGNDAGDATVVHAEGRHYPVEIRYLRHGDRRDLVELVAATVPAALAVTGGHVLVFLPGVGEIRACERALAEPLGRQGHVVLQLSGDLPPEAQDRALADHGRRKVILATNVAETSLTIAGVTAVIDSGLARRSHVTAATGLPRLELVPISRASADQRAGRAGRTSAGVCWRLWDEPSHRLRPDAEPPESIREDVAAPLLHLLAIGEARDFDWLDPPPPASLARATMLLRRLGATERSAAGHDTITPLGRALARLPAHPRLARLLLAGAERGCLRHAALAAALLSDRDPFRTRRETGGPRDRQVRRSLSDVVDRVAALESFVAGRRLDDHDLDPHPAAAQAVIRAAEQFEGLVESPPGRSAADPDTALRQALLDAFPDRLARLRPGSQDRGTLVGGRGVRLRSSCVRGEPLVLAVDLEDSGGEADVRLASAVDRAWLNAESAAGNLVTTDELVWHPSRRQVEARRRTAWLDLMLEEAPAAIGDDAAAAVILAREAAADLPRVLPADDSPAGGFLARCRWLATALPELGLPALSAAELSAALPEICRCLRSFDELKAADWLLHFRGLVGHGRVAELESLAPSHLEVRGKRHRLAYEPGRPPVLAARIQDLFGVREIPRVAGGRVTVLLHLLAPNHRPQQVTDDLAGFWQRTYPLVRQELRRRYPKHVWPEDPLA
ncbi:MAG: ATP-dependent helicase HrpB [Planctomycetes bacterium]|nr:ATP-dependent helicase HrpB [Planctomycetota bacterium]